RNEQQAQVGVGGVLNLLIGVVDDCGTGKSHERQLHVRLAGGEPYVADEDIAEDDGVGCGNGDGVGAAGVFRRQVEAPVAELVRGGGGRRGAQSGFDLLAGIGSAPEMDGPAALQNHVAAEDFGEGDFGPGAIGGEGKQKQKGAGEQENVLFHGNLSGVGMDGTHCTAAWRVEGWGAGSPGRRVRVISRGGKTSRYVTDAIRRKKKLIWMRAILRSGCIRSKHSADCADLLKSKRIDVISCSGGWTARRCGDASPSQPSLRS